MSKCPDLDDVSKIISVLHDEKFSGAYRLHPEVIKRGGRRLVEVLYIIIKDAWENLEVPACWKDAKLVTIFKKENKQDCSNYRWISPLSIPGKVFARLLLNWVSTLAGDFFFYLRFNVGSAETEEPWTWYSCKKYRRFVLKKMFPSTYLSTSQKPTILGTEKPYVIFYGNESALTTSTCSYLPLHTGMKASVSLRGEF